MVTSDDPQTRTLAREAEATGSGSSGAPRAVIDPATEGHLAEVQDSTVGDVERAVAAAGAAFDRWAATTPRERADALNSLADRVAGDADELAALEARNVGKPGSMARDEIDYAIDNLRFFAGAGRCLEGRPSGEYLAGYTSSLRREPVGVVGLIAPWNYPLMMAIWKLAPALAAGNTCVLKPAEQTPLTTLSLASLAADVFPAGVVNVVTGPGEPVGRALVSHPDVRMVSLTGSVATGQAISEAAAATVKRVHLELGGNAPVLVFDDADIEAAAETIKVAGYWNAGQECAAACRVIATPRAYDSLLEALVPAVESIKTGGPMTEDAEMGPLITDDQRGRVVGFLERAERERARILTGGEPFGPGFFFAPTVVTDVAQGAEIVQREVFGPVVTVQRAGDEEEAIGWANGVVQGLSASVWTNDLGRANRSARGLRFGTVWVNDHLALASEMPWTGFSQSGHGYDQSVYAIEDYTQLKHVMVRS
jgi:aminobutyraldehyde dehydrogenase